MSLPLPRLLALTISCQIFFGASGALLGANQAAASGASAEREVALIPSETGALGAWLRAGPIASQQAGRLDPSGFSPTKNTRLAAQVTASWELMSSARESLNLKPLSQTAGSFIALGAELEVKSKTQALLLISADGALEVWLSGRKVHERSQPAARGNAQDPVRLELEPGKHTLVFWLKNSSSQWAFNARLLDEITGLPPSGLRLLLPGTNAADGAQLTKSLMTQELSPNPSSQGYTPSLSIKFPQGFVSMPGAPPLSPKLHYRVDGGPARALSLGALPSSGSFISDWSLQLPAEKPKRRARYEVQLELAGASSSPRFDLDPRPIEILGEIEQRLAQLSSGAEPPELISAPVIQASLRWYRSQIIRAINARQAAEARGHLSRAEHLLKELNAGQDPLTSPGVKHLAARSRLDGSDQPFAVHFPQGYQARAEEQRYPLVIALHGLNSNPERIMRAFLDSQSNASKLPGFVIAPHAHGNSFYRDAGEQNTLDLLDWALEKLPVDPERVSITGVSMGGTGVAHLALRYPERFSAASPLCGYHSYFIRRDTNNRPVRPWEREQMHHFSPASWVENGVQLPLYVAHGTQDFPLENSKVLIEGYKKLGFQVIDEWPEVGHDVWTKVWKNAGMWPWLSQKRRAQAPSEVRIATTSLRYGKRHFIELLSLEEPGHLSRLKARVERGALRVETQGIQSFQLVPPLPASAKTTDPLSIEIDGAPLSLSGEELTRALHPDPSKRSAFQRSSEGSWSANAPSSPAAEGTAQSAAPPQPSKGTEQPANAQLQSKRPGAEGPIRDIFMQPLVFVYGTKSPLTSRATYELAQAFAHGRGTAELSYRIISDRELTKAERATHNLVLLGGARDNWVSAGFAAKLKSRVENKQGTATLSLDELDFSGETVGAAYIQPHPESSAHSILVFDATHAIGYWIAPALPQLLPDFVVYDRGLLPSTGQQILSSGRVLAGGFFDSNWRLPKQTKDTAEP